MQRGIISVAARAFVRKVGDSLASSSGGNPVTVFIIPSKSSTARLREDLAKSCAWESVCVVPREADAPKLFFYMPTGEEVIFCAHATCGAASVINMKNLNDTKISYKIDFVPAMSGIEGDCIKQTAIIRNENVVEISMSNDFKEGPVNTHLIGSLLEDIGLDAVKDVASRDVISWPFLNSSVARFKTLIPMKSLDRLHAASNPRDPVKFQELCDESFSTGVYLYCPVDSGERNQEFECRQFPRASYPEDPATGVAAAALAASLRSRGLVQDAKELIIP